MDTLDRITKVRDNIKKVLICKDETIDLVLSAVLSRGHVLIEDVPGIGKTTLVRALAAS
ncbi:MAG: AAA family ATPase, partial [Eubacteriales bacterium]